MPGPFHTEVAGCALSEQHPTHGLWYGVGIFKAFGRNTYVNYPALTDGAS